ncbi:hypothetical protein Pan216_28730 [Planctomycetes bacterium Pan216]|uniref:Transglycosylase associated protein n=1 Tax=Kolteria novifilia TaxID=2527975 RepID=A0A518B4V8_9BACT|nr:hypothetical protein Pan216_28730 [Planctomycetes bacterium Pan216]
MIVQIIGWALFGLICGALARLLVPGRQNLGCITTSLLGIAGSLVGGSVAALVLDGPGSGIAWGGWILSILGAVLLLVAVGRSR